MTEPQTRPGYAHFDGTETPDEVEAKVATAFAPVTATLEGLRRATSRARIEHYRKHPPRDSRGRFAPWEATDD